MAFIPDKPIHPKFVFIFSPPIDYNLIFMTVQSQNENFSLKF
jgi:hypothetical protein